MQHPMYHQMREVGLERLALFSRFGRYDWSAQHDVAGQSRGIPADSVCIAVTKGEHAVVESKDVGRVILAAEISIQSMALGLIHKAQRNGSVLLECGRCPDAQPAARWRWAGIRRILHGKRQLSRARHVDAGRDPLEDWPARVPHKH